MSTSALPNDYDADPGRFLAAGGYSLADRAYASMLPR